MTTKSCGTACGKCWSARVISGSLVKLPTARPQLEVAQRVRPDVIIMDVMMPLKNGIDACREITETLPNTRVLMLTAASEEDAVVESVAAGAMGYLLKYSGKEQLLRTVREVAQGEYRIPAESLRRVFSGIRTAAQQKTHELNKLTSREREILALFARGQSYAKIAEVREISR